MNEELELAELLIVLSPREKTIVQKRFGLGCKCHTLQQVADYFDVGRERIRQLQNIALSKLRRAASQREEFIDNGLTWPPRELVENPPKDGPVWTPEQKQRSREAYKKTWEERMVYRREVEVERKRLQASQQPAPSLELPRHLVFYNVNVEVKPVAIQ